jgi:hypothetical protein
MLITKQNNKKASPLHSLKRKQTILYGIIYTFILFFNLEKASAQNNITRSIIFQPYFGNDILHLNDTLYQKGIALQIEAFKFYITGIELLKNERVVFSEINSFHLLDVSEIKSLTIPITTPAKVTFDQIRFYLGIDSLTNVSGAYGGDLDPTKGMYWTWQNGYINFKLEGKSKVCTTQKNEFQFHVGGYQFPYNTIKSIVLDMHNEVIMTIRTDVKKLIEETDLSKQNQIMSPGAEALFLSEKMKNIFSIQ